MTSAGSSAQRPWFSQVVGWGMKPSAHARLALARSTPARISAGGSGPLIVRRALA